MLCASRIRQSVNSENTALAIRQRSGVHNMTRLRVFSPLGWRSRPEHHLWGLAAIGDLHGASCADRQACRHRTSLTHWHT
jgi:hypothetical protein